MCACAPHKGVTRESPSGVARPGPASSGKEEEPFLAGLPKAGSPFPNWHKGRVRTGSEPAAQIHSIMPSGKAAAGITWTQDFP